MAQQEPKIEGAILQSGRIYKAGEEAELAKVLPQFDIERLIEKGALSGDWSGTPAVEVPEWPDDQPASTEPAKTTKKGK